MSSFCFEKWLRNVRKNVGADADLDTDWLTIVLYGTPFSFSLPSVCFAVISCRASALMVLFVVVCPDVVCGAGDARSLSTPAAT